MPKIKPAPVKKQIRRFSPGRQALREIKRWQKSTQLLIRELPFQRLVKEILNDFSPQLKFSRLGMKALQHASEDYLVKLFQDTLAECLPTGRVTIMVSDMNLALRVQQLREVQRGIDDERKERSARYNFYEEFRYSPNLPEWEWDSAENSSSSQASSEVTEEPNFHDTWSDNDEADYEP